MALESDTLDEKDIVEACMGLMEFLRRRAANAIVKDAESAEALTCARQYWAFVAMVDHFGTALIAFDDIDADAGALPN